MYTNLFHLVSTGKVATQWFNSLFDKLDKETQYKMVKWITVKHKNKHVFLGARTMNPSVVNLNSNTFYYNVNYDYNSFINKIKLNDDNYCGIYIYRDPREYVMSAYYSWMFSHPGGHEKRKYIRTLSKDDGLKYVIDQTKSWNEWDMIRSWGEAKNDKIIKLKFEDIFGTDEKQANMIKFLNKELDLKISDDKLNNIISQMNFKNFSGGRKQGETNNNHHYRNGKELTWKSEMSEDVLKHFYDITGDLVNILGYE